MSDLVCWVAPGETERKWAIDISRSSALSGATVELRKLPLRHSASFELLSPGLRRALEFESPDFLLHDEESDAVLLLVEVSNHNPMGANTFQRLARLYTAAKLNVPAVLIAPARKWVSRVKGQSSWQEMSPVFFGLLQRLNAMSRAPIFYVDSSLGTSKSQLMRVLRLVRAVIRNWKAGLPVEALRQAPSVRYLLEIAAIPEDAQPLTSRKVAIQKTADLAIALPESCLQIEETVVLTIDSATFRADPYAGWALAADLTLCRQGLSRVRTRNLVVKFPLADPAEAIRKLRTGNTKEFRLLYTWADALVVGDTTWVNADRDFVPRSRAVQTRLWVDWESL